MNSLAIGLVVLSAVIHAVWNFLLKEADDKQIFAWWLNLSSLTFFFFVFIYFLFVEGITSIIGFYLAIASGFVVSLYWYFLSKSYDKGELSQVYPISRTAPALILVFAIVFLKEVVSFVGVLGILTVVLGAYIINMKRLSLSDFLDPITSAIKNKSIHYAFFTLIAVTAYSIIDKIGVSYISPYIYVYLIYLFAIMFLTPYIFFVKDKVSIINEWKKNKKFIMISGFLAIFGYLLILFAFTLERVSYVVGLRQLSIIFAVLLGAYVLKENSKSVRIFAAVLIFIGTFLISIAD
tara:strand:- start:1624 stop:2502 length:879 start_codon:yes stop_codon:yes gene_type:complete